MKRRQFIKGLLAASSAATVAVDASIRPPRDIDNAPQDDFRHVLLQHSPLAGFQFYEGEDLWPKLVVGQELALMREPANKYDPRAVMVGWDDPFVYGDVSTIHRLGYLPRRDNCAVQQLMDRGEEVVARISELTYSDDPGERVVIDLFLLSDLTA